MNDMQSLYCNQVIINQPRIINAPISLKAEKISDVESMFFNRQSVNKHHIGIKLPQPTRYNDPTLDAHGPGKFAFQKADRVVLKSFLSNH